MTQQDGAVSDAELKIVTEFVYREAELADESRYEAWEALWEKDAVYWVPATSAMDSDPEREVSYIYDNRSRIATRVKMLTSGVRFSQTPPSPMRRVVSNLRVERDGAGGYVAHSNFVLVEIAVQSTHETRIWAGRTIHKLRPSEGGLKMYFKKIVLVNGDEPIANLSFLI